MEGMGLVRNLSSQGGDVESCNRATTKKLEYPTETTEPSTKDSTVREVPAKDNTTPEMPAKESTTRKVESNWPEKIVGRSARPARSCCKEHTERLNSSTNNKNYAYEALAYLPYADDERHAFIKLAGNLDVVRNEHKSVNYVVSRRRKDTLGSDLASQWTTIEINANGILKVSFSARVTNLTSLMEEVAKSFGLFLSEDGFRALVALRCGYEFVWYELGYRYFHAGYATGKHTLVTETDNKYSDKCGQITFFP